MKQEMQTYFIRSDYLNKHLIIEPMWDWNRVVDLKNHA